MFFFLINIKKKPTGAILRSKLMSSVSSTMTLNDENSNSDNLGYVSNVFFET